jgi:hypothetical protein
VAIVGCPDLTSKFFIYIAIKEDVRVILLIWNIENRHDG